MEIADHWIEVVEGRLFARSWQADSALAPILLLHDSLGSVELWREFPALLNAATNRTVIAYDRLGYGKSDPNPHELADHHIETESTTIAHLLDGLGVDRFVAFGHSIGAEMGVACGSRLPQRCAAVIAMSAQTWVAESTLASIAAASKQFSDPEQRERLRKYHGDKTEWVLDAWIGVWNRPSMRSWTIKPELPQLHCPLLVIHGERDGFSELEQPTSMAQLAGGPSHLEIIPDCGHLPHREQPDIVLSLVADFLRDVD